jgi:hypothetical protein
MKDSITIRESIFIQRRRGDVWDFTQDYGRRTQWDKSIKACKVLQKDPLIVDVQGPGLCAELAYKQNERPYKTSLAMNNIRSLVVEDGGGSWKYEDINDGCEWTQTNTLVLRPLRFNFLLKPMIRFIFRSNTRRAMRKAKKLLEGGKV